MSDRASRGHTFSHLAWCFVFASAAIAFLSINLARGDETPSVTKIVQSYCIDCHDAESAKGKLNLASVISDQVASHSEIWEKVVDRLRTRQMPPIGKDRPTDAIYNATVRQLESDLDHAASGHPNPGRTDTIRRLTRTEYQNAIRDLLAIEIDATSLLPADEASHGFDNVTVGNLSPTLLDRYVTAAEKISRLAVGGSSRAPGGDTIRVKPDITQEDHIDGLPLGTRGGTLIHYTFPRDGEYDVQIRLTRDRNEHVEGMREPAEMEILLDRDVLSSFKIPPPRGEDHSKVDANLKARIKVKSGPHDLGITFLKMPSSLIETLREPYHAHFNFHRHPRLTPAVYQVSITGPFDDKGPGDSPSRRKIFASRPAGPSDEEICAKQTLLALMRHAYRRPVGESELQRILPFYADARKDADFDAGIESALSAILVSPEFLFRVEEDPAGLASHTPYRVNDLELASRLSFFLWSSIPDEQLLTLAEHGQLHEPAVLAEQTRRMLADPRSSSLVSSFAAQWLHLRNLDSITPDGRLFPDFDDNLRQAMRRETEMHVEEVMREDRSVMDLIKTDHTFLNERLATHYGIPNVYGTRFRRVDLPAGSERGGLLRQASILTVTSYATRTSPVLRGKWILETTLGIVPPPPPPNVPALKEDAISETLPVRERLTLHRANAACANCHKLIDPPGFALENFDAIGRWRTSEQGAPVDASAGLPDGSSFTGVDGLEAALLRHPDEFTSTMTEKLLTYSLGRGVDYYDAPAIRQIVREAKDSNYRFSALIGAVVKSVPVQMRMSP